MALMREDLDKMRCGNPKCPGCGEGPLFLNAKCHPRRGVEAEYHNGVITIRCRTCQKHVTTITVASSVLQ